MYTCHSLAPVAAYLEQFCHVVIFRCADVDTGIIYEKFLTYIHATSCTAMPTVCRQGAVHAIRCTFDAVLATLEEIENDNDRAKAMEARGLLLQIKCFKFVLSLVVFDRLLSC